MKKSWWLLHRSILGGGGTISPVSFKDTFVLGIRWWYPKGCWWPWWWVISLGTWPLKCRRIFLVIPHTSNQLRRYLNGYRHLLRFGLLWVPNTHSPGIRRIIGCNRLMLKPFLGQIPILSNMSNGLKAPFSTIHPESFATKSSTVEMFGH